MKFNPDVIMMAIIDQKKHFLRFVDYINEHSTGGEFPSNLYAEYYERFVRPNERYVQILSLETLVDNGFFQDFPSTGQVVLVKPILDILSFLDTKRSQQLVNAEFEDMRKRTVSFVEQIQYADVGSDQQNELINTFKNLLSEIHSKVQQNTKSLQERVIEFSIEYKRYEAGISAMTISDLYAQVNQVFHRNVKPFLDFTTTDQILRKKSFHEAMTEVMEYFEQQGQTEFAYRLSYRLTAITSYYKDVLEISEKIRRYLDQLGKDKSSYLAIENAFAKLMNEMEPLRHGGTKHTRLRSNAAFFRDLLVMDGLANHKNKYSAKLKMKPEGNEFLFSLYLERLRSEPIQVKRIQNRVPLARTIRLDETRKTEIMKLVSKLKFPMMIDDIYFYLHEILGKLLSDYSLKDILFGLELMMPMLRDSKLQSVGLRGRLEDDRHYFEYSVIKRGE